MQHFWDMLCSLFCFPHKAVYFIYLFHLFSVEIMLMFFINHELKFKYLPGCLKVD